MDNGLTSVPGNQDAVHCLETTKTMLEQSRIELHEITSNGDTVMKHFLLKIGPKTLRAYLWICWYQCRCHENESHLLTSHAWMLLSKHWRSGWNLGVFLYWFCWILQVQVSLQNEQFMVWICSHCYKSHIASRIRTKRPNTLLLSLWLEHMLMQNALW